MAFSLVIDDLSLALLLGIVVALSASIYTARAYQPLIHPLILSRQADVSKVRQTNESAIYRNANSPSGFDLAEKPRKEATSIAALVAAGAKGTEAQHSRQIYDRQATNAHIARDSAAFAAGLVKLSSAPASQICAAITVEMDSYESLVALLAGAHSASSSPFHTLVLAPSSISDKPPSSVPPKVASAGARAISAIFTTPTALRDVLSLGPLDPSALVILPTQQDVAQASNDGGSHRLRFVSFQDVLDAGSAGSDGGDKAGSADLAAIHSHYWRGKQGWTAVSHGSLISGVTTHLSFYPADKIPSTSDRIYVEASASKTSLTPPMMATVTPSGLAIALLALYTGAGLAASTLTNSWEDANPAVTKKLFDFAPTLIYATAEGASSLACALTTVSRRASLSGLATRSRLYTLRNGTYGRHGLFDALVYRRSREATGCLYVRNVVIVGQGSSVLQGLLDSLRIHLGCAVQNTYLPSSLSSTADVANADEDAYCATAPISATHSFDLQAFADKDDEGNQLPAHVGPPAVSVEIKVVQTPRASTLGLTIDGNKPEGFQDDPMGEVYVRGKTLTGSVDGAQQWLKTGDLAGFRANGTLVVFQDAAESAPVGVPTLSSRHPVSRRRRSRALFGPSKGLTAAAVSLLAMVGLLGLSAPLVQAADSNSTLVEVARTGMLAGQRASWEQGTGQSALLELDYPAWSVFTSKSGGPPYKPSNVRSDAGNLPYSVLSMAYHSAARQDRLGRLAFRISGDENITAGSALDGTSAGEHVLLAAWIDGELDRTTGELGSGMYADAARRALNYILEDVPRSQTGAISHRATYASLWSDAVYMGPPFIAYYGLMTRNDSLLQLAYDQVRLYRDGLRYTEGNGANLWGHIRFADNATWTDAGTWVTGNGWVTAGMLRVLATIEQSAASNRMTSQKTDLVNWIGEVLDAAYPFLDEQSLLFHNYLNQTDSFLDSAGTALMVYSTFRLASVTGRDRHVDVAERIYGRLQTALSREGIFRSGFPTVDVLGFTHQGDTSSESLSFMMLMDAARRDYRAGGIARVTGTDVADSNGALGGGLLPAASARTAAVALAAGVVAVVLVGL
ncbi:uncharacterized protein PFL1_00169 [Pseudozyma flocculosa PF-1]|uniref:Uncharacterized protein n=1 Tax=Pseudozyma flocculosa TaxID=84751 RepID=A0A5C3EVE0_9BASI|nr:uncharacterized protein PFL1_00169 [Pseudozyma flocculosa PF-1]EPQ31971.1 hypothetical protein PFL1_00169 [Pseudozyma flocculosa PF-1]SPO35109.1 uncharacterized protein PSFLO_00580 [Pseudozyma flocculosa]